MKLRMERFLHPYPAGKDEDCLQQERNRKRKDRMKCVGTPVATTLALAALKLLGIVRFGWLVVFAPLAGTALGGMIIAAVEILWILWRKKDELYRNL